MTDLKTAMQTWIESRPESVRKLAAEFPMGSIFDVNGQTLYLLGYNENDVLILSDVDPYKDYDGANESRTYVCASHFRKH